MADEDLRAELERLRKENEALKQAPKSRVTMKVSDKGGLSVYGLGRFPVTLTKSSGQSSSACRVTLSALFASMTTS